MKRLNNQSGFTVIELILSFVFVFTMAFSMYELVYNYSVRRDEESVRTQMNDYKNDITLAIRRDISDRTLKSISYCNKEDGSAKSDGTNLKSGKCLMLYFNDDTSKQLSIETDTKEYDGEDIEIEYIKYGKVKYIADDIYLMTFKSDYMLYQTVETDEVGSHVTIYRINIPIYHNDLGDENFGINLTAVAYDYDNTTDSDTTDLVTTTCDTNEIISSTGSEVGDEVTIGTEKFYIIENNGSSVQLLAKYNLDIPPYYKNGSKGKNNSATGKQSETAVGGTSISGYNRGVIAFSSVSSDWLPSWVIRLIELGVYPYIYGESTSAEIYKYINNYVEILKDDTGIDEITGNLLKAEQAVNLGCVASSGKNWNSCTTNTCTCKNSSYNWIYSTSYWLGDVYSVTGVAHIKSSGAFHSAVGNCYEYRTMEYLFGVRPVITIPACALD